MKKLIVLLFIFVSFLKPSFAQPDSIKVIPTGLSETKFKVNSNAITIYNRTLSWINETYQNPDKVITGKVEGKSVNISGYLKNAYNSSMITKFIQNSDGTISYISTISSNLDVLYHLYITINDSIVNYKFVIDDIYSDGEKVSGTNELPENWFQLNGELRESDPRKFQPIDYFIVMKLKFQENIIIFKKMQKKSIFRVTFSLFLCYYF